tara:strand:- start:39 stop:512 length:474 start_codon:yes stop_codon:yes gene_type:complete
MQDVAREITELLEPSQPAGHRLVITRYSPPFEPVFEAKAVPVRGSTGFMVRMADSVRFGEEVPPVSEFRTVVAPSTNALKFLIRSFYSSTCTVKTDVLVMPPGVDGYNRMEATPVDLDDCSDLSIGEPDSFQERALGEAVAALTLMRLPDGLKWDGA